ncbi:J domain-containing protein [Myxococcota bacterium]|nr:J domain-containing protein [Myxococcota bacterium]MBU1432098.1 J domain-containing protein [Myxococcota bacterium]MBU1896773.1 J domain-containing protein [Myxococcota bacterium]
MDFERAIEILGVNAEADLDEARRAYLRLIRAHRPESDPEGFRRVRAAWEAFEEGYTPPAPALDAAVIPLEIETLPNDLLFEAREALEAGELEEAARLGGRALAISGPRAQVDLDHVAFLLLSLWGESADALASALMNELEAHLAQEKPRTFSPPMAMILDLWRNQRTAEARIDRALVLLGRRKRITGLLDRFESSNDKGHDKGQDKGHDQDASSSRRAGPHEGKTRQRFNARADLYDKLK